MQNYIQTFIVFILVSLVSIYRLLMVRGDYGDKRITKRLKYIIAVSSAWAVVAFIVSFESKISSQNSWIFWGANKGFYLLALLFTLTSYYFIKVFPVHKSLTKPYRLLETFFLLISASIVPLILLSNSVSGTYRHYPATAENNLITINTTYGYESGSLSIVYGLVLIAILLLTIYLSLNRKANLRATEKQKAQSRIIVFGITFAILMGSSFQLILPAIVNDYPNNLYTLGQLAPIFMTFSAYYAVLRYKLFDIKASAFRAVGYSLSIATMVGIYTIIIYGIIVPIIYPGVEFGLSSLILVIAGTASTIFLYGKIKTIFDLVTDKLFFKNSYSLPKLLDEFNQALINSSDIGELATSIFKVIGDTLKVEFFILIVKSGNFEMTIDSRKNESLRETQAVIPLSMINYHFKASSRVAIRDYLDKRKFEGLHDRLMEVDTPVAIDLSEASKTTSSLKKAMESGDFKTMLLGPKRSGESYNSQDLEALRIISKELVVGLQNSMRFEEIKLFNIELQHKVDLATAKLRQQNKKLVVADELKDDFLSIASHQMRTPISAINGYASILDSGDAGKLNKDQQKFAKIIANSTKKLSYLINDFLTVSRLKSGKFSIEKTDADLTSVLKGETESIDAQFKAKNIKLNVNIDGQIPIIRADESKVRQVMMNLIDNALYYTKADGEVNVTLRKDGQGIVFEVKDNGIGVPKHAQADLFSKMFRAENAQKVRPDGTGLGLYLAKKVILGHKGHIIFHSVEGEGSTFGFRIPLK